MAGNKDSFFGLNAVPQYSQSDFTVKQPVAKPSEESYIDKVQSLPQQPVETSTLPMLRPQEQSDTDAPEGGFWTALGATMFQSARHIGSAIEGATKGFQYDPNFNPHEALKQVNTPSYLGGVSPEENAELLKSKSLDEFQWRTQRIYEERLRQSAQSTSTLGTIAGSFVDADTLLTFGAAGATKGLKALGIAQDASRLNTGIAAAAIGAGAQVGLNSAISEYDARTGLEKVMDTLVYSGALGFGAGAIKSQKTITGTQEAILKTSDGTVKVSNTAMDIAGISKEATLKDIVVPDTVQGKIDLAKSVGWNLTEGTARKLDVDSFKKAFTTYERIQGNNSVKVPVQEVLKDTQEVSEKIPEALKGTKVGELKVEDAAGNVDTIVIKQFQNTDELGGIERAKKVFENAKRHLSTSDTMRYYADMIEPSLGRTPEDVQKLMEVKNTLKQLYPDTTYTTSDSVIQDAVVLARQGEARLNLLDDVLGDVAVEHYGAKGRFSQLNPFTYNEQIRAERAVQKDMHETLLRLQQLENDAKIRDLDFNAKEALKNIAPNKGIEKAVNTYLDSGFAQEYLKQMKASGLRGSEHLAERQVYAPLRWDYSKMLGANRAGLAWETMAQWFGRDIVERFPALLNGNRTVESVGMEFINTQKNQYSNLYKRTQGTTKEVLHQMLANRGMDFQEAGKLADELFNRSQDAGKLKSLRKRNNWDFSKEYVHNGQVYKLSDFTADNLMEQLHQYSHTTSQHIALARKGIEGEAGLNTLFEKMLEFVPKEAQEKTRHFLQNSKDQLLGRAVGEPLPDWARTLQSIASSTLLTNAGVYNVQDLLTTANGIGFKHFIKNSILSVPALVKPLKKMNVTEAARIKDVLTSTILADGKLKNFVTHFEDNHVIDTGMFHTFVQKNSQLGRFANLSEIIRRFNVEIIARAHEDYIGGVAEGKPWAIKYFKRIGMSDELQARITEEYKKHGLRINKWDADTSLDAQRLMQVQSDNLATAVHAGEVSSFLEHSTVGKFMFPYMRFAFSGTNKIMRATYNQQGSGALAVLMLQQAAFGTLLGAAINVTNGRRWDDQLDKVAVNSMTSLGYIGWAYGVIKDGGIKQGNPVFSPLNNVLKLSDYLTGQREFDAYSTAKLLPLIGQSSIAQGLGTLKSIELKDPKRTKESNKPKEDKDGSVLFDLDNH